MEDEVVKTQTINIAPDPTGMWRWIQSMNEGSLQPDATAEAVKLWMLTAMFPFAAAKDLLLIVKGDLDMEKFLKEGVTLEKAMAAIAMVLAAAWDEDGEVLSDQETCETIYWAHLKKLHKAFGGEE